MSLKHSSNWQGRVLSAGGYNAVPTPQKYWILAGPADTAEFVRLVNAQLPPGQYFRLRQPGDFGPFDHLAGDAQFTLVSRLPDGRPVHRPVKVRRQEGGTR